MTVASRLVRVNDAEYAPATPLVIPSSTVGAFSGSRGSSSISSGTPAGTLNASIGFGFTPTVVLVSGHDLHSIVSVSAWSSSGFTVAACKKDFSIYEAPAGTWNLAVSNLGTVGFSYIALS